MDAIGSALGIYRLSKTLNKEANIVVDSKAVGISSFLEAIEKDEEYIGCVINGETALEKMTDDTLLVIVDTNKTNYVESIKVLENAKKVVEIDHHRKSTDYIKDTILSFHEVYASSASELVTEIIQYSPIKIKLSPIEVEALYAGIMLDTKEFTFKTGVRTFEAAAYLRKCGVDIIKVKKWFQDDLKTYQIISNIISKAEIVKGSIAISTYNEDELNTTLVIAKAADELLTISGISASFVLGKTDDTIYISGRSIGDINVQLILEKLGGGGHITLAGAQLPNTTIDDALLKLKNAIDEYMISIILSLYSSAALIFCVPKYVIISRKSEIACLDQMIGRDIYLHLLKEGLQFCFAGIRAGFSNGGHSGGPFFPGFHFFRAGKNVTIFIDDQLFFCFCTHYCSYKFIFFIEINPYCRFYFGRGVLL